MRLNLCGVLFRLRCMNCFRNLYKATTLLAVLCLLCSLPVKAAKITRHSETASGLQGWSITDERIEIQLNPLQRDQVRAFYLARGFSDEVTQEIERSCVFQAVMSNISSPVDGISVGVDLSQWRIVTSKGSAPLTDKDSWLQRWDEMGASQASNVAFRWATFPWQQRYVQSGDYGWGMILLGADLPEVFSVLLHWTVAGQPHSQRIDGLSCPE